MPSDDRRSFVGLGKGDFRDHNSTKMGRKQGEKKTMRWCLFSDEIAVFVALLPNAYIVPFYLEQTSTLQPKKQLRKSTNDVAPHGVSATAPDGSVETVRTFAKNGTTMAPFAFPILNLKGFLIEIQ